MAVWSEEDAAARLVEIRPRLVRFFAARGFGSIAEELADEAAFRVLMKIRSGVIVENLDAYALGVSRMVALEQSRRRPESQLPDGADVVDVTSPSTPDGDCLEAILGLWPESTTRLLLSYYGSGASESKTKAIRRGLCEELGISSNALVLRISKLRVRLAQELTDCIERGGPAGQESGSSSTQR